MKIVLQRVKEASVKVNGKIRGQIKQGLLVFVGFSPQDDDVTAKTMIKKLCQLRIFNDDNNKMNLSVQDVAGGILVVSQFTLYGDCKKGRRPSFIQAEKPAEAEIKYEAFLTALREVHPMVESGEFGADMKVSLVNDGPVTFVLE